VCLIHCPSAPVEFCHVSICGQKPRHIELSHRVVVEDGMNPGSPKSWPRLLRIKIASEVISR
jgi:hypothetical protein